MKISISILLVVLLSNILLSQQYLGDNKLVIEGNSNLIIEADRASFSFSVNGFGSTLREAIVDAKNKVNEANKILFKYNIPQNSISTSSFESGENFGGKAFLSSSKDFKTITSVYVIVESLSKLEDIIIELSEQGIESISNINYSLNNIDIYKTQAKEEALEDAKERAKRIAEIFGIELNKVIYIEEIGYSQTYPNPFNPTTETMNELNSRITLKSLFAKPIKITQRVKIIYEI